MAKKGTYDRHIKIGAFQEIVQKEIDLYMRELQADVPDIVMETGKQCVARIKAYVAMAGINDHGYGSSWKIKVIDNNAWLGTFIKVHSPRKYRIAHLLEHGHPIKDKSGKTLGSAKAFPHMRYAEQDMELYLENKLKQVIAQKG